VMKMASRQRKIQTPGRNPPHNSFAELRKDFGHEGSRIAKDRA
jgi:hypothetical protein